MKGKIDFCIIVRDRSVARVQRCVNSLKSHQYTGEIIVCDYGSKKPFKLHNARVIRYSENDCWNKSHGLNLAIRSGKSPFVCTVDCDMILSPKHLDLIYEHLGEDRLIINTNVRRLALGDISDDYDEMLEKSTPWFGINRGQIYSAANGGIQCFSRKWINKVCGYCEGLGLYFGAMDNRIYEQAFMTGLRVINLNLPMLHQEHDKRKEDNLPEEEREFAKKLRAFKVKYLEKQIEAHSWKNRSVWGKEKPNQDWIIKLVNSEEVKAEKSRARIQKIVQKALKLGKTEVMINGKKFKIHE